MNSTCQQVIAPLVLRLGLGAIFLYHGLDKIANDGSWGANWAPRMMIQQEVNLPPDVIDKLQEYAARAPGEDESPQIDVVGRIRKAWRETRGNTAPEALGYAALQLAVAWGEVAGGLALLVGWPTRLAALAMLLVQGGAIYTVTFARGFVGGYEFNVALVAMCLALAFMGGGKLSLDYVFHGKRDEPLRI
jgi:uncharacterized membrane protein YphA (DoxX/SURF4 family)